MPVITPTDTPAPVLTPHLARELKDVSRATYSQLSDSTKISRSQICEFICGIGRLRPEQLAAVEKALRKAMVVHSERVARLVAGKAA